MQERIRLTDAAKVIGVSAGSLRRESEKGRLVIWRVAGKDWTTMAEIDRMFELCQKGPKVPVCGLNPDIQRTDTKAEPSGSLKTEATERARAALLATVRARRNSSRTISQENIAQNAATVVPLRPSPLPMS